MSQDNVASVMTMLWAGLCGTQFLACTRHFLLFKMSRLALEPTQPPIKWVLGGFFAWW